MKRQSPSIARQHAQDLALLREVLRLTAELYAADWDLALAENDARDILAELEAQRNPPAPTAPVLMALAALVGFIAPFAALLIAVAL